ncbi:TonB C-terminal domain-containing protein [Solimicrobium silvestre]|uniref:TonB C terminal n=1 Tax=Solimicrobium silvestre TaxID=2099400 RepID=A0A2S9GUG0_9BURK|nr:TonB C-terminal domain-containing protein [Solimicrobium silvestre]PRC91349.1 TonB C terminal [Solimicrobium silvestre]
MQNPTFTIAIIASLLAHAVLLLIHFVDPPPLPPVATDPGLDVILVNAKHDHAPLKAQALAQANLDGGGNADDGRAKSPIPDMHTSEDGDAIRKTQRRIEELENLQDHLLSQADKASFKVPTVLDKTKTDAPKPVISGDDQSESHKALTRMQAEIAQTIEDQNKRPRKTFITPSTKAVGYAMYYKNMQKRIEDMGTMQFPEKNGEKLYGELIVYIPIFQDGTIYEKEGGPRIEKSSGNKALDKAALRIVRHAGPFGTFPQNMRSSDKDDLWIVITRFKFTHDLDLITELKDAK